MSKYTLPRTLATDILERKMSKEALADLAETYHLAKFRHATREPSEEMFKTAEYAIENGVHDAAKKFKATKQRINYCVERVGAYYLRNKTFKLPKKK